MGPLRRTTRAREYYANLFVITNHRYTKDEIWVGSDDGLNHVTNRRRKELEEHYPADFTEVQYDELY